MISSHKQPLSAVHHRSPQEEEQRLCNEALRTGDYDAMSDKEWVALCERAADDCRHAHDEAPHRTMATN